MENYIHVVFNSKLNIEQRVGYSRLLCPSVVTAGINPIFQYEIFPAERLSYKKVSKFECVLIENIKILYFLWLGPKSTLCAVEANGQRVISLFVTFCSLNTYQATSI